MPKFYEHDQYPLALTMKEVVLEKLRIHTQAVVDRSRLQERMPFVGNHIKVSVRDEIEYLLDKMLLTMHSFVLKAEKHEEVEVAERKIVKQEKIYKGVSTPVHKRKRRFPKFWRYRWKVNHVYSLEVSKETLIYCKTKEVNITKLCPCLNIKSPSNERHIKFLVSDNVEIH